jgi:hypothetical protein
LPLADPFHSGSSKGVLVSIAYSVLV